MLRSTRFVEADIAHVREQFTSQFDGVQPAEVILIQYGGDYALVRYQAHDTEIETGTDHRLNRRMYVVDSSPLWDTRPRNRSTDRLKGNVYGTACLRFVRDEEFSMHWPTAYHPDTFIRLANRDTAGNVVVAHEPLSVVRGNDAIRKCLAGVLRPGYLAAVVNPFLEGTPTVYELPRWHLGAYRKLMPGMQQDFTRVAATLIRGDFIYVGCKEEVFLFGVAKSRDGSIYWQGTYTASTKPPLYFTNAGLDHANARDCSLIGETSRRGLIAALSARLSRRPKEAPEAPFICPQMGRRQCCKYSVFTGQPEIITGDLRLALQHFATTDFAEFADIVQRYAEQIRVPHPTARPCSEAGFYI